MATGAEDGIREMGSCEFRVGVMVSFWNDDEEEEGEAGGRKSQVNHLFPWRRGERRLGRGVAARKGKGT
ncbi:hypothetical protein E2C01_090573 [Portunus trituberculatus]|uniref:Uncharacterized protein n=1 Tax=Portunus trituberculatus TaxID=210409 RepID=A0A5B7JM47_PORTR|nr:hypothetical protein [Portunus trituberculatus]